MTRPESNPEYFVFRDTDGRFKCRCYLTWSISETSVLAWTYTYAEGLAIARQMRQDHAAKIKAGVLQGTFTI